MRIFHLVLFIVAGFFSTFAVYVEADELPPTEWSQRTTERDHQISEHPGAETPEYYFQLVCLNCQNGEHRTAARQLRKGMELLKHEAKHATIKGKAALDRSILELENLANTLQQGTVSSVDHVKSAFARANHALAYHYQQRASESWLRRKYKQAGEDFKAASYNVEYGISWVGERVETKSRDVLVATRELGNVLIRGTQVDAEHVESRARSLGLEIKRFGRRVVKPVRR